jgi:hypothetical protein
MFERSISLASVLLAFVAVYLLFTPPGSLWFHGGKSIATSKE